MVMKGAKPIFNEILVDKHGDYLRSCNVSNCRAQMPIDKATAIAEDGAETLLCVEDMQASEPAAADIMNFSDLTKMFVSELLPNHDILGSNIIAGAVQGAQPGPMQSWHFDNVEETDMEEADPEAMTQAALEELLNGGRDKRAAAAASLLELLAKKDDETDRRASQLPQWVVESTKHSRDATKWNAGGYVAVAPMTDDYHLYIMPYSHKEVTKMLRLRKKHGDGGKLDEEIRAKCVSPAAVRLHIPRGWLVIMHSHLIHAGAEDMPGQANPRAHFYIFPRGLQKPKDQTFPVIWYGKAFAEVMLNRAGASSTPPLPNETHIE